MAHRCHLQTRPAATHPAQWLLALLDACTFFTLPLHFSFGFHWGLQFLYNTSAFWPALPLPLRNCRSQPIHISLLSGIAMYSVAFSVLCKQGM